MAATAIVLGRTGIGKSECISHMKKKYDRIELVDIVSNGTSSCTQGYHRFKIDSIKLTLIDTAGFLDSAGEGKEYEALLRLFNELQDDKSVKALIYLVDRLSDFDYILIEKFQKVIVKPNIIVVQNKVNLKQGQTLDKHIGVESKNIGKKLSSVSFTALPMFLSTFEESVRLYEEKLADIVGFVNTRENITVDINGCDLFFLESIKMSDPFKENRVQIVEEEVPYQYSVTRTRTETYSDTVHQEYDIQVKGGFLGLETFTRKATRPVTVTKSREVPYTFQETRTRKKSYRCTYELTKQEKYRIRLDKLKVSLGYVLLDEKLVSKVEI